MKSFIELPMARYQADDILLDTPTLSAGIAERLINRSPAHAWAAHPKLGNLVRSENSAATDVGTLAHALLFEGVDHMAIIDPASHPSKSGEIPKGWTNLAIREARDSARKAGKVPVLKGQEAPILEAVKAAQRCLAQCKDLDGYTLAEGNAEHVMVWSEGQRFCRARPDWSSRDRKVQIDAKFTGVSANPEDFSRQVSRMAYDLRAAFYERGNRAVFETDCTYVFLVVETEPPYASCCMALDPIFMEMGRSKVARAIDLWDQCLTRNHWPAYPNRLCYVTPPGYAVAQWEEQMQVMDMSLAGEA